MATIVHVNAVGLMSGVESATDASLRGRPFIVASGGRSRAVVLDVSPEAYREGLSPGMPLALALARVPDSTVIPPHPDMYREADMALRNIALSFTPLVERAGSGHLFIDLAGTSRMLGAPADAMQKLRRTIIDTTGLRPALALSSHRTASKVATRVFRPGGFAVLSSRDETVILRQQPVGLLPGVGPVLDSRLIMLGIDDIGRLADLDHQEALAVGQRGPELVARARCSDDGPVVPDRDTRASVDGDVVFEPDTTDPGILRSGLWRIASDLAFSLRKRGLGFRRATVTVTYVDGAIDRATRPAAHSGRSCGSRYNGAGERPDASIGHKPEQRTALPVPGRLAMRDDEALALAMAALAAALHRRVRVRRISLELSGMEPAGRDLDLFEPEPLPEPVHMPVRSAADTAERLQRIQNAADALRNRYGRSAVGPCFALRIASDPPGPGSPGTATAFATSSSAASAASEAVAFASRMSGWGHW